MPVFRSHISQRVAEINQEWQSLPATAKFHVVDTTKM